MGDGRRARESGGDRALQGDRTQDVGTRRLGQRPEELTEGRAHHALERLLLVRVAAERAAEARMVENQRRADHRDPARQLTLELESEPPALRGGRFEKGVGACWAQDL